MPKNIHAEVVKLYHRLCTELEQYRSGRKFLSHRAIRAEYLASRRATDIVLARLRAEKRIVCSERKGIFATQQPGNRLKRILYLHTDWPSGYCNDLEYAIEKAVSAHGYEFRTLHFLVEEGSSRYLPAFQNRENDAIIVAIAAEPPELAQMIDSGIPLIFLADHFYGHNMNLIDCLPEYTGMIAANHLLSKGHRRIGFLLSEPPASGEERRNNGFRCRLRLAGVEPVEIDCGIQAGEASPSRCFDVMSEYLEHCGGQPGFTALFTMSDATAIAAMYAIQAAGLRVPEDISVIGCYGAPEGASSHPQLTTVARNHTAIGQAIADGLDALFNGDKFGVRIVPPFLLERDSVKKLATQNSQEKKK